MATRGPHKTADRSFFASVRFILGRLLAGSSARFLLATRVMEHARTRYRNLLRAICRNQLAKVVAKRDLFISSVRIIDFQGDGEQGSREADFSTALFTEA